MLRVHLGGPAQHGPQRAAVDDRTGRGSIIAITSELAIGGGDGDAHYAAAKGAVIGWSAASRSRSPATVSASTRSHPGPPTLPCLSADSPWRAPEYLERSPNRRLTRPDEIAEVVRFLLNDDTDFCIGEVLSPNSGAVI